MDALLMCGGRGTRLDAEEEKPLYPVGGRPMVDRVRAALERSRIETVHAVGSPHAPATRDHLDCASIEAPGEGYVADLEYALERVDPPVLTAAADLPLLDPGVVNRVLDAHEGESIAVYVPAALKRLLGASVDSTRAHEGLEIAPAGLNVVAGDPEETIISHDARLAVNVNRTADARIAEVLL